MGNSTERVGVLSHAISKPNLKPGDHIYCYRCLSLYRHHGIYTGDPLCEVIHFTGGRDKTKSQAKVIQSTLQEFCDGDQLCLVAYNHPFPMRLYKRSDSCHKVQSESAKVVIKRATEILRGQKRWDDYNLIKNNCEHFAVYCKTGERYSSQGIGRTQSFMLRILTKIHAVHSSIASTSIPPAAQPSTSDGTTPQTGPTPTCTIPNYSANRPHPHVHHPKLLSKQAPPPRAPSQTPVLKRKNFFRATKYTISLYLMFHIPSRLSFHFCIIVFVSKHFTEIFCLQTFDNLKNAQSCCMPLQYRN